MTFSYTDLLTAAGTAILAFGSTSAPDAKRLSCNEPLKLETSLRDDFGQIVRQRYVVDRGEVLVYTNANSTQWTVTLTEADGVACVVETGHSTPIATSLAQ